MKSVLCLVLVDEVSCYSGFPTSADPVDLFPYFCRHVIVDDMLDIREIKTLRLDIGSHQNNLIRSDLEGHDCMLPFRLIFSSMHYYRIRL
jgi:hypothetical protein